MNYNKGSSDKNKDSNAVAAKGRSNRYENDEEVDSNDIDLEAHETLEGEITTKLENTENSD